MQSLNLQRLKQKLPTRYKERPSVFFIKPLENFMRERENKRDAIRVLMV